jgi:hypothetical protein
MSSNRYLLCIPCYNCETQVIRVLDALELQNDIHHAEIALIDNKSLDGTAKAILNHSIINTDRKIKVFENLKNYGLGGSFKLIVEYAFENNFDYIIWLHGDDQAEVKDIIGMQEAIRKKSYDAILGSRFIKGASLNNYSKIREWGNLFINLIFTIVLGKKVLDTGSGLNMYRVAALPREQIMLYEDHIAFDINVLFHFMQKEYKTLFYPIIWKELDQVSNAKNVQVALVMLKILWRWKFFKDTLFKNTNITNEKRKLNQIL